MKSYQNRQAIVYMAVNIANEKRYIGITTRSLAQRKREHYSYAMRKIGNSIFHKAIRKYGRDSFEFIIVKICENGEEAIREEMRLIAEIKPEYNLTAGGEGQHERKMSADGKRRLSAFHKGKAWHSMPHSEATKQRLSEIGSLPENKERWEQYSSMGPASMARKVICEDDGEIYTSASAAARHYGVAKSALIELCLGRRNRKTVGGHKFSYLGDLQ